MLRLKVNKRLLILNYNETGTLKEWVNMLFNKINMETKLQMQ